MISVKQHDCVDGVEYNIGTERDVALIPFGSQYSSNYNSVATLINNSAILVAQ